MNKPIKFIEKNYTNIILELETIQKKCKSRTISFSDIQNTLNEIDSILDIPKTAKNGIIVNVDCNAQKFPAKYHFIPESTHFSAIYKNGYWYITAINRYRCRCKTQRVLIYHTEKSKEALIKRFSDIE